MSAPYENTILGLLKKRRHLLGDVDNLRKSLSCAYEDIRALDRTLKALGYSGNHERMAAAGTRKVLFRRDQLRRFPLGELRDVGKPMLSRDLAERTMHKEGLKTTNQVQRDDMVKRVCQRYGCCAATGDHEQDGRTGFLVWELVR